MFWAILNLLFSIFEIIIIQVCTFCFMRINRRTVFLKKRWYILCFTLSGIITYVAFLLLTDNWSAVLLLLTLSASLGLLFHRKALPIILDILFSVVLFLGMEGGIFIGNILLSQSDLQFFPNPASIGCLFMGLKIIIAATLAAAMIQWKKVHNDGSLSLRQTITILLLPAFSVFFLYSLMQMSMVYTQLHGAWLILGNIIALLLLNVYFLYLFRYLFKVNRLEQEMQLTQIQNELQYRHYEELEQKYHESRKILHDMKNHLQAVEQLYEGENRTAGDNYVQDLYHMINILGEKYYSANRMLNIILNDKLSRAKQAGIRVKAEIGDAAFDDLKDMDITIIFANLLDNAIEAAAPTDARSISADTRPLSDDA